MRRAGFWIVTGGTAALVVLSLFVGVISVKPQEVLLDADVMKLVFDSRFPRTAATLIAGAGLAVSGLIMQMLVRNKFVEPMTAGTGQGAALGVLVATLLFPAASILTKMLLATLVALAATVGMLGLVRRLPPSQPLLVPLVAMIYGAVIWAAVVFIAYQADLLQFVEIWISGEFSGVMRGRYELLWIAAVLAGMAYVVADQFAIAGMGREASLNLGLKYDQVVLLGLGIVSIVSAVTIVTVGMIAFVGLIVPNIVSRWLGDNLRATLPITALCGASLVLASDILGRLLRHPFEIPVGTILGVLGSVVFLWLLYAGPRHAQ